MKICQKNRSTFTIFHECLREHGFWGLLLTKLCDGSEQVQRWKKLENSWCGQKRGDWERTWPHLMEKTLESPLDCKEIKPVNPRGNQPWIFIGRTDAEAEAKAPILWLWRSSNLSCPSWWEELTHWERLWCWERLRAGGEGGNRGLDGWLASLTRWTLLWANCWR